jgi:hypothetical protein
MTARRPVYQGGSTGRRHGKGVALAAYRASQAPTGAAPIQGRVRARPLPDLSQPVALQAPE